MTFSIVGRCPDTGKLGVAVCSSSIAVGARCPWIQSGTGAVSTQNVTLPSLGPTVLHLLAAGRDAQQALDQALREDAHADYRQLIVIDRLGQSALFTGAKALGTHHAVQGRDCVAAGNLLADPAVIDAMVQAFDASAGQAMADRLLLALRAALDAGGEAGPVHAAALLVAGRVSWPEVNLRVDWHDTDPVGQLQALWHDYRPQAEAYLTRALQPDDAPSYGVPGDE